MAILPEDLQPSDHHIAGLMCWWPELSGDEGSPRTPESATRGRLTIWHFNPASQPDERHLRIPEYLSEWPMLFRDHPSTGTDSHEAGFSRPASLLQLAQMLRSGPKGQWWWPVAEGALGQALHTGIWTRRHGSSIAESMPRKEGAHLYASAS